MTEQSYTNAFTTTKPAAEVFAAVANPRAWWSEEIDGLTDVLGAISFYHHKDIHRVTLKVAELEPGRRIVWHVLQNYFNFTKDQREWTGTDLVFDLAETAGGTEVRFTHRGLVPSEECYEVCNDSWNFYIASLRSLIETGAGQPNRGETNDNPTVVPPPPGQLSQTVTVAASPADAFAAITRVREWWTGDIEGATDKLGDSFSYRYGDMHFSRQLVTEFVPGRRIAWQVLDSDLSFLKERDEWTGTTIVFDILPKGEMTEVRLTHVGVTGVSECFDSCEPAWGSLVKSGLKTLIETGRAVETAL